MRESQYSGTVSLPSDHAVTETALDVETSATLIDLNYSRMRLTVFLTAAVIGVFFGPLSLYFPADQSITWVGALVLTAAVRYGLYWRYARTDAEVRRARIRRWAMLSTAGSCLGGASWAVGPLVMMPGAGQNSAMLLVVTVLSVSAVALTALSAHLPSMIGFVSTALFPSATALWLTGGAIEHTTGWAVLAAAFMLMIVGRNAHQALRSLTRTEIRLLRTVEQLEIARGRAEAASTAKTRFLSNMTHELRTPLNAVIGAAQLLESARTPNDGDQHLIDAIKQGGTNLLSLIESVLDVSRIEAGALQVSIEDFNLLECVEVTAATAAVSARIKGLALTCIVAPEVATWRRGDPALLRQVLLNLLGNAVKFTARGEVVARVTRGAVPEVVNISITDTGIGIPESALQQIFEPFTQVDAGTNRRFGGSGLGLTIVRELTEAMGGSIAVRSQLETGTCFEIALELSLAEDPVPAASEAQQLVAYFEPHEPSAEALAAHLTRLRCHSYRCDTPHDLRDWLIHQRDSATQPWLLLNCDAPAAETFGELARAWPDASRVVGMTNRDSHGRESLCPYLHLSHHLVKPLLRSTLVSRLGAVPRAPGHAVSLPRPPLENAATGQSQATHVLIVEDDLLNQTVVSKLLTHAGYRVSVAPDGACALAAIAHESFDLVLMDWHMPDMDGLDVTRRMRAGAAGPLGKVVPIVALTANAFAEDRAACLAAGMNDYLTKPVIANNLFTVINRWTPERPAAPLMHAPVAPPAVTAFDPTVLAGLPMVADGSEPDYAGKILDLYLASAQRILTTIAEATLENDTKALLFLAHKLKSSSASVGALALAEAAAQQERQLRTGQPPVPEWLQRLRFQYTRFERAVQHHRASKDAVACASI